MRKFNIKNVLWYLLEGAVFIALIIIFFEVDHSAVDVIIKDAKSFTFLKAVAVPLWGFKIYFNQRVNGKIDKIVKHIEIINKDIKDIKEKK